MSPVRSPGTGAGRGSADTRVAAPSAPAGRVTRAGAATLLSPPRSPRRNAGPQTTQVNSNVTSPGPASPGRQRGRGRTTGDPLSPLPTGASNLGSTAASVTSPPSVTPRRGAGSQTTQAMLRLQARSRLDASVVGVGRAVIPFRCPLLARLPKMGRTQLHRPFWTRYSQLLNRQTLIELMVLRANLRLLLSQSLPLASCPSLQQGLGNATPPCPQLSPS